MKRLSPAILAALALIGAAACKDAVTSPQVAADAGLAYSVSNPPPPKIDTGANGRYSPDPSLRVAPLDILRRPRYTIQQSSPLQQRMTVLGLPQRPAFFQSSEDFNIPAQYSLNTEQTKGELQFKTIRESKEVVKTCTVKYLNGVFTGKGTLEIQTAEGLLVIDCSSVQQPPLSWFEPCGDLVTPGQRCFHLVFDDAWLNGVPGMVEVITGCDPDEVVYPQVCPDFTDEEIE